MASLITLRQAKDHLRMTTVDQDAEIELKCESATYVVLEYLSRRAHESATTAVIESSSEASPTVITTESPHGLSNAASVFISGHANSVPNINGTWTIADVTSDTFTIPAAVTTEGTGGRVSVVWTIDTVPAHIQHAILLMLTHLFEHRGDDMDGDAELWMALDRLLVRSRDRAFA